MEQGGGKCCGKFKIHSLYFLESGIAFGPWHVRLIPISLKWQNVV